MVVKQATRSLAPAELRRLKISPEVANYLQSRSIPFPDCPPLVKTPEPHGRGVLFDGARVDRVLASFAVLRHTQGRWAGKPLTPDSWQVAYILAPTFGWIHEVDGRWVRVIRHLYVEVSRKGGKSTMLGGILTYMLGADGEQGAQVIAAASTKDQASFVFAPIKQLVQKSPDLKGFMTAYQSSIVHQSSGSVLRVITSVAESQFGGNIHCAGIDELHIHKTPDLVDALETGVGAREQPLIVKITTADDGRRDTIYDRDRRQIDELAAGVLKSSSTYGVVWAAEDGDDPFSVETQKKANPGYGISPTAAYLADAADKARMSPANLSVYLRLHLGIRTKQETKYLDLGDWDVNAGIVDVDALKGKAVYGHLDLATTTDLTALCWLFPDVHGGFDACWHHWIPEEGFDKLNKRTSGNAAVWRRDGWLTVTDGAVMDYEVVKTQVRVDMSSFKVRSVGYDPWNATQLVNDLQAEDVPMIVVRQGYQTLSAPMKELLRLSKAGTVEKPLIRHGGNPLVRWQVGNLGVAMDPAGNVKPSKAKSGDKIDGLAALIGALYVYGADERAKTSVYETRGAVRL